MKKILFLIHDLGQGGAEKVLVNLVNNMDRSKFDISVTVLFGGGVNEQFLKPDVHFHAVFPKMIPGNSKLMKLLTPEQLHKLCVKEEYDIEVSYLEGPAARVISGCCNPKTKLVSWIHTTMTTKEQISKAFRSEEEAQKCYMKYDNTICVSKEIKEIFCKVLDFKKRCEVLYNTVESEKIKRLTKENISNKKLFDKNTVNLLTVGTLKEVKGYDRLLRIFNRLQDEGYVIHLYMLGKGPMEKEFKQYIVNHSLENKVTMLGYELNPYKYIAATDILLCSSYTEGFSTVVTESLIVGTPVCTVEVSGMKEMLGDNNEYGIVTDNNEEALYQGIKRLLDDRKLLAHYKKKAEERGKIFDTESTVKAVEEMLLNL